MKKLVSILITGSMALSMLPGAAFAETGTVTGAFSYEESFDTPSEYLPAGWTIYTPLDAANTAASVSDGALTLTNTAGSGEWILFDALTSVSNKNLVMECDITYLDNAAGDENSVAGLAYMVDIGASSTTNIDDTFTGDGSNNKDPEFTGLKGNYAALKTDSANSYQQVSVRKQRTDRRCDVFNTPRNSENNETDSGVTAINQNNGEPVHLKIAYQGVKYCLPYIYINGVELVKNTAAGFIDLYSGTYSDQAMMSGKVGFYIKNANVKIDNLKISGTGTYTDATTYKAAFKTAGAKYESVEAATADVLVAECDLFGNVKTDVTAGATITPTDNGDGTGTISVTYGDYSTTLSFSILPKETRSFVYEENFDTMADGSLPAGWTLYRNKTGQTWRTINAQVKNGALEFSENNKDGRGGYLIFDIPELANVDSQDLTMECDITLGNSLGVEIKEPTDIDCVGFAYAFDESKITGQIDNSSGVNVVSGGVDWTAAFKVRMYTNKENDSEGTAITNQILDSDKYNQSGEGSTNTLISNVNKINTAETTQTMKLKIAVTDTDYYPTIYLNGTEVENSQGDAITPARTSGKIGLYIKNAAVTIDNIKITGTKSDFAPDADSLAISKVKYDSANSKLSVAADASLTAAAVSANSAIIAAVYDNSNNLVSVKTVDASNIADYHGTITLNDISSAPAAGKVKVFFWNMSDMKPITNGAVK